MKKNDYIIASINNPDFTAEDFKSIAGYSLKDTQMLKEEDYLSNDFIKNNPLFQDSTGMFRKELFSEFYKQKLKDFGEFSTEDFADTYQYSAFDTRRKGKDKVSPFGLTFFNNPNPTMQTIGVEGPNILGQRTLSDREIAQKQKIFDTASGQFTDISPNDQAFTKNPFKWAKSLLEDPLVLAVYDDAGVHQDPITGKQVKHNKGDKKLNTKGLPYYERLNGRSLVGRDLLSATDILTVDGSAINKYDFLDSDDIDKSIGGVIMKTAAAVAPLFITSVAPYYGTFLMLRELGKTAPMLYAMGTALFNDKPDQPIPNTIAAYMNKITTSTSDYSKGHTFSLENFGSLISDVALQWEQQMAVVRAFQKLNNATNKRIELARIKAMSEYEQQATKLINDAKLGKISVARAKDLTGASNLKELKQLIAENKWENTIYGRSAQDKYLNDLQKYIENRTRLGQDLSLGYMALISNTDVYSSALEHGADKKEAALLAAASTAGMFSVDKYLGLGEMFFQVAPERQAFRRTIKHEVEESLKRLTGKNGELPDLKGFFNAGAQGARKAVLNFREAVKNRDLPIMGKAIGEGLEEVSEELVTDLVKSAGELAADFGWTSGPKDLGAWDNMGDRYLMSFIGGTIGGGIFGVKQKLQGVQNQSGPETLQLLIRQGRANDLRSELKKMYEKGQLGPTNLSIVYEEDKDHNKVFLTPDEKHISQNEFMYNTLSQAIDQIQSIIEGDRLGKSENDLFEQLVLKDERYLKLSSYLQDKSYLTGYQQRYQDLVQSIIENQNTIRNTKDAKTEEEKGKLKTAQDSLNQKLLERDRFLNGELSLEYLKKLNFIMNPAVSRGFIKLSRDDFAQALTGANYSSLDAAQQWKVDAKYHEYIASKDEVKDDIDGAYKAFEDTTSKVGTPLMNYLQEYGANYQNWEKHIQALEDIKQAAAWNWDTKLPIDADDETFKHRDTPMEGEDLKDFVMRRVQRQDLITQHNESVLNYLQQALNAGVYIDETTRRRLAILLGKTELQIKKWLLEKEGVKDPEIGKEIMDGTPPEEVLPKLRTKKENEFRDEVWNSLDAPGFSIVSLATKFGENNEITETQPEPVDLQLNGESLSDDQLIMQEAQQRMMDQLGIKTYNISNLYNALGTNPAEVQAKFYEIYNGILQQIINEDQEVGKYPALTYAIGNVQAVNHPVANLLFKYGEGLQAITATDPEERRRAVSELERTYNIKDIREAAISNLVDQKLSEWEETGVVKQAGNITRALEDNNLLKMVKQLKEHGTLKSPGQSMLEIVGKILSPDVDISKLLEELGQRYDLQKVENEFEITEPEKQQLQKAKEILEVAKSIIAGMYQDSYLGEAMSYNRSINEFVKAHKEVQDNWEDLPTINREVGQSIYHSLELFTEEIEEWLDLSNRSSDNKVKNIREAKAAYEGVKHNVLFETLKGHSVLKDFDGDNDLAAEVTVYRNAQKQLKEGKTVDALLDEYLQLLEKNDQVLSQITSEINQGLGDSTFTAYDRLMYMATISAIDKSEYLKAERDFFKKNPDIASLPTQEPAMVYAYALKHNPDFIYKTLDKIAKVASSKGLDIPVIYGLICTGIGGAGKTKAVARFFYDDEDSVWLSGPDTDQVNNLKEVAPKGRGLVKNDLIDIITGGNRSLLNNYTQKVGLDKTKTLILSDISDSLITKDAPKYLIIDEATHFSNLELQVIGQWAKKGGTKVLYLGDENQLGNSIKIDRSHVDNLEREQAIGFRAPRMAISLRTGNRWKTENQTQLVYWMNQLRNAEGDTSTENIKNEIIRVLKDDYRLKYWENESDIHGDKIVKTADEIDFSKLQDKEIAYIGNNFSQFAGKTANIEEFKSLKDIQGKEFQYVICDNIVPKFDENVPIQLLNGLRTLYTAISRSKIGSIIIDSDNNLSIIHQQRQSYTTESVNLSEDAIREINQERETAIGNALSNVPEPEETKGPDTKHPAPKQKPSKIDVNKEISKEEPVEEEFNGEFRAYSNIGFLGGVTKVEDTKNIAFFGPMKYTKWAASGVRKDIGIFGDKGILANTPQEKAMLVYNLACLKSIFNFNKFSTDTNGDFLDIVEFNNLPKSVQDLFNGTEDFRNIHYYAVAEDYDETMHSLIGLTTAKQDKVSFIKGKDGKDKVLSIQARIPGKYGEYTITIGAVANPGTWAESINSKEEQLNTNPPSDPEELKALQEDIKNQKIALKNYEQEIADLLISGEVEIDKPKFSGQTEILYLDEKIPLADYEGGLSTWEKMTANFAISPVHIIIDDLKEINPDLSDKLKGRPVIFVSSDPSDDPNRLKDMWKSQQQHKDTSTAKVRMIVIDNRGISFNSLYNHVFEDIYTSAFTNQEGNDTFFSIPVETEPEAMRIFINMWNFRANLVNFNTKVKELMDDQNWTMDMLQDKVKTYNDLYNRAKKEVLGEENDQQSLSDPLFLKWLNEHPDVDGVNDTLIIRDFNTSLKTREFRLGYSKDGAYISRILGEGVSIYPEGSNPNGIYITPQLASQYEQVINNYFDALVNPVFKDAIKQLSDNTEQTAISSNIELALENWYDEIQKDRTVTIGIEGKGITKINVPIADDLKQFTLAMIRTPYLLKKKALKGNDVFMQEYNKIPEDGKSYKYRVKLKVGGVEQYATYTDIDKAFEFNGVRGILQTSNEPRPGLTGEIRYDWETPDADIQSRYIDTRMDTFLSLMFHGVVAQKVYNDFEASDQLYASDADFRHGIFIDATLKPRSGNRVVGNIGNEEKNFAAETNTNNALFITKAVPGSPIFSFSLKRKTVEEKVEKKVEPKAETNPYKEVITKINTIYNGILGTDFANPNKNYNEVGITKLLKSFNNYLFNNVEAFDLNNILFNLGQESLFDRYKDKYSDLANIVSKEKKLDYILLTTPDAMYMVKKLGDEFTISLYTVSSEESSEGAKSAEKKVKTITLGKLRTYITNYFKEKYPDHLDEIKSYMQGWTRNKTITRDYNQKQAVTALEKAYSDSNTENDFIEMKQQFAEALNAAINELFC